MMTLKSLVSLCTAKWDMYSKCLYVLHLEVSPLDRYIRSASICNTLALLVSQGNMIEFLQRISLLMKLQNCWTKGHRDIKLHCSSDDDSHDDVCQLSLEEFSSDNNSLQPAIQDTAGSAYNSEGDCWKLL